MEQNLSDIFDLVEHAIDNAFEGQMNLKFYDYLKDNKTKKYEVDTFIDSTTATEINDLTQELEEYIKGGATENPDDEKSILNKSDPHINRGVELLLRNRRAKPEQPKTFQVKFGKMVALFKREIVFHLNFYLDIRKK